MQLRHASIRADRSYAVALEFQDLGENPFCLLYFQGLDRLHLDLRRTRDRSVTLDPSTALEVACSLFHFSVHRRLPHDRDTAPEDDRMILLSLIEKLKDTADLKPEAKSLLEQATALQSAPADPLPDNADDEPPWLPAVVLDPQ